jgi:hypothetical protein
VQPCVTATNPYVHRRIRYGFDEAVGADASAWRMYGISGVAASGTF